MCPMYCTLQRACSWGHQVPTRALDITLHWNLSATVRQHYITLMCRYTSQITTALPGRIRPHRFWFPDYVFCGDYLPTWGHLGATRPYIPQDSDCKFGTAGVWLIDILSSPTRLPVFRNSFCLRILLPLLLYIVVNAIVMHMVIFSGGRPRGGSFPSQGIAITITSSFKSIPRSNAI